VTSSWDNTCPDASISRLKRECDALTLCRDENTLFIAQEYNDGFKTLRQQAAGLDRGKRLSSVRQVFLHGRSFFPLSDRDRLSHYTLFLVLFRHIDLDLIIFAFPVVLVQSGPVADVLAERSGRQSSIAKVERLIRSWNDSIYDATRTHPFSFLSIKRDSEPTPFHRGNVSGKCNLIVG
jgi:hypothetical protein